MNVRNSYKIIATIMCILIVLSSASFSFGKEKEKLTVMQEAFFKICELKEQNNNLSKKDIDDITDNLILEKTVKRELDVVNTYSKKSEKKDDREKISVFRSLEDNLKIEGVIYSFYNPNKDVNVIRLQYHNLEDNNRYIRLEITTENINYIDTTLNKTNPNILKSDLYTDYKNAFNVAKSNDEFSKGKFVNKFKEVESKSNDKQFKTSKGSNESLIININNSDNKLKNIYYDFGVKSGKFQDCLNMTSRNYLDQKGLEYYNIPKNSNLANTLMIFKNNSTELKELFLNLKI